MRWPAQKEEEVFDGARAVAKLAKGCGIQVSAQRIELYEGDG